MARVYQVEVDGRVASTHTSRRDARRTATVEFVRGGVVWVTEPNGQRYKCEAWESRRGRSGGRWFVHFTSEQIYLASEARHEATLSKAGL